MAMKFDRPRCPECGELAWGMLEQVPGLALLLFDEDGRAEYDGETKMFWDDQTTCRDEGGRITLECPNGHRWPAGQVEGDACTDHVVEIAEQSPDFIEVTDDYGLPADEASRPS